MSYDRLILLFVLALVSVIPVAAQTSDDRITIERLKRKLDAKEKIVILDARTGGAWVGSTVKIKGARHITLDELEAQMKTLPKNREIIAYCT